MRYLSFVILLLIITSAPGCYIPHPANRTGIRTLRPVERWEKVCTIKRAKKNPAKYSSAGEAYEEQSTRCRWVRSR
jgi:hypothetical protein